MRELWRKRDMEGIIWWVHCWICYGIVGTSAKDKVTTSAYVTCVRDLCTDPMTFVNLEYNRRAEKWVLVVVVILAHKFQGVR